MAEACWLKKVRLLWAPHPVLKRESRHCVLSKARSIKPAASGSSLTTQLQYNDNKTVLLLSLSVSVRESLWLGDTATHSQPTRDKTSFPYKEQHCETLNRWHASQCGSLLWALIYYLKITTEDRLKTTELLRSVSFWLLSHWWCAHWILIVE